MCRERRADQCRGHVRRWRDRRARGGSRRSPDARGRRLRCRRRRRTPRPAPGHRPAARRASRGGRARWPAHREPRWRRGRQAWRSVRRDDWSRSSRATRVPAATGSLRMRVNVLSARKPSLSYNGRPSGVASSPTVVTSATCARPRCSRAVPMPLPRCAGSTSTIAIHAIVSGTGCRTCSGSITSDRPCRDPSVCRGRGLTAHRIGRRFASGGVRRAPVVARCRRP